MRDQIFAPGREPIHLPIRAIPSDLLASDSRALDAVLGMSANEIVRRLPHFRLRAKTTLEWPGEHRVVDEQLWKQAPNGQFSTKHQSGGEVVEWLVADGQAFVKNGKGPWRMKPMRIEQIETQRQLAAASVRELFALFAGTVALSAPEAIAVEERSAVRYKLESTATERKPVREGSQKSRPKSSPLFGDGIEPLALTGTLTVDRQTGVLLGAELKASVIAQPLPPPPRTVILEDGQPTPPPTNKTTILVRLSWSIDALDGEAAASLVPIAPKAVPEVVRQRPVSDPLGFWKPKQSEQQKEEEEE